MKDISRFRGIANARFSAFLWKMAATRRRPIEALRMTNQPTNLSHVEAMAWKEQQGLDGKPYRFKDLSGQHIGVFIEELPPGSPSSMHHFHTLEEEHVMILEGEATLIL